MKILLATGNAAKVARNKTLLQDSDVEFVIPTMVGLEVKNVIEGSDIQDNAKKKALAYMFWTDLPVIGMDSALHIDGEDLDPAKVRRNALEGIDESQLGIKGIAHLMLNYYKILIKARGGRVEAYWEDAFAIALPDGSVYHASCTRHVVFTDEVKGEIDAYFPLKSLYEGAATGKRPFEQTAAEHAIEMKPYKEALEGLVQLSRR